MLVSKAAPKLANILFRGVGTDEPLKGARLLDLISDNDRGRVSDFLTQDISRRDFDEPAQMLQVDFVDCDSNTVPMQIFMSTFKDESLELSYLIGCIEPKEDAWRLTAPAHLKNPGLSAAIARELDTRASHSDSGADNDSSNAPVES